MAKEYELPFTAEEIEEKLNKVERLSEEIADLKQNTPSGESALTIAQVEALDGMFKKCAFTGDVTAEYNAFKLAFGIEGGNEEPDTPTDKTLSSISAVYTGGDVAVGTAVNSLAGITVTAAYSDGSTTTVTGYTLSGTIAEGSNTITVSYGGMTTTFTVTGVAESGGEEVFNEVNLLEGKTFHKTAFSGEEIDAGFKANTYIADEDMTLEGGVTYYIYAPYEKNAYAVGAYFFSNNSDGTYTQNDITGSHYYMNGNIDAWNQEKEDTVYYIDEGQTVQLNRYEFTPTETVNGRIGFNPSGYKGTEYPEYIYMFTKEYNPYKHTLA